MRGWCGEVQPGSIRSSPAPLWPIIGPVALWYMDQLSKYIRDCPPSLWSERRGNDDRSVTLRVTPLLKRRGKRGCDFDGAVEQRSGFEPPLSAWKADVLTVEH